MRWIYNGIRMKYLVLTLALLPALAMHAGQITIVNPEEEQTEKGKTLCMYQNSIYMFTYVTKGKMPVC